MCFYTGPRSGGPDSEAQLGEAIGVFSSFSHDSVPRVRIPPPPHIKISMKRLLFIDVETYSSVDIAESGAYKYTESPDFEILIVGYAINDMPVRVVDLLRGEELPDEFTLALMDPDTVKVAHNAVFERLSFKKMGFDIPARQWYCTAVKAAYCGLPLSLDGVSKALGLKEGKLDTGKALIKYFSCPCKPTRINGMRSRNFPHHAPEKWEMYKEYNDYDVRAERELFHRLEKYSIPQSERRAYVLDQKINDRGILIDMAFAESAISVYEKYTVRLTEEARRLTGLDNPNSNVQVKQWIEERTGDTIESLDKKAMPVLVEKYAGDSLVSRVLEIRKRLSRTSVKKYYTALDCAMDDSRARGLFQFYGANRTGRWAGRLLQLQNLSKNHIPDIAGVRGLVARRDGEAVELLYDDVTDVLSQLVRPMLVAPEGKVFSVADFSAIEARVISWLADEKWRMDVFHGDGKIYEATGSKMFGVPVSAIKKGSVLRDKSKISELALGYEGGVGALKRMGGESMGLSEAEMADLVNKWRYANPAIVKTWRDIEKAATQAVLCRRPVRCTPRGIVFDCDGTFLTALLPSGRKLFYYKPIFKEKYIGGSPHPKPSLFYYGTVQKTKQFGLIDTYGGKLTENLVQAIARDLLVHAMEMLDAAGFPVVFHVHDECIAEVPADGAEESLAEMSRLMGTAPDWAADLPLRADGYVTPFYIKD